ncbi:MAG: S-layer homology domain-containing protein [Oscillospiraceae bacterium]|nr:S-layer homology domain-containing protein [Oscillospiraceae bacterium]
MKTRKNIIAIALAVLMILSQSSLLAAAASFSDTGGHWAQSATDVWSGYGVVNGYPDGSFRPDNYITRAETAQIIVNLMRIPAVSISNPFGDVKASDWFYDAVIKNYSSGYVAGYDDGTMRPDINITREQAMVILGRTFRYPQASSSSITFVDAASISDWATGYVYGLVGEGLVVGYEDGTLQPLQNVTRAEVVTMLGRAISTYAYEAGATYNASGDAITLVVADGITITGSVATLLVGDGASGGEVFVVGADVDAIKLVASDCTVYVDVDSNVNRDNVEIIGRNSKVVYEADLEDEDELPAGVPDVPVAPWPGSAGPSGGGGGGGTTTPTPTPTPPPPPEQKYTVSLEIFGTLDTLKLSVDDDVLTKEVTESTTLAEIYASDMFPLLEEYLDKYQTIVEKIYGKADTVDLFDRAYTKAGEGMAAYYAGGQAWEDFVDRYITDVNGNTVSDITIALRNRTTVGEMGEGTWGIKIEIPSKPNVSLTVMFYITLA